jgi:hypothetical protein
MRPGRIPRSVAAVSVGALLAGAAAQAPAAAEDPGGVLPGHEDDVGVYTDGASDSLDIGEPEYTHLDEVAQALEPGVPYTADSMYRRILAKDTGGQRSDFYVDRVLGVHGTRNNDVLQTRGRTLYMRGADRDNFAVMGFAGSAYAGGPNNLGDLYTLTVPGQEVAEDGDARFNAPSHATSRYAIGDTGVRAEQTKLVTHDNVALTALRLVNDGDAEATLTVRAASPLATSPGEGDDTLTGTRTLTSGSNNGLADTPWSRITVDLRADGFTRADGALEREVTVPAGGEVSLSVAGALYSEAMPASPKQLERLATTDPAKAVRRAVRQFHVRWADDVPYVDVPDPALEKAIVYRWWGERYNTIDAGEPGYVYQYPTTVEGSHLYQNSVVLTQPMHLQDTKWLRDPHLAYGQILNVGELSGGSAFLDSPGHTSWNNHYSQYLGTAGLEAYQVHGGGPELAERFASYFDGDATGQLAHYDGNDDGLIAYDTNYMPGNDADAITFGYPRENAGAVGARTIERPESAYVWGAFDAARQLYGLAGEAAKAADAGEQADRVRAAVLDRLWSPTMRMFLTRTSHGATAAPSSGGGQNPLPATEAELIPAKESNLYDVYAQHLIPADEREKYVEGLRFLRYGDNFPIFPFYTANQHDRDKFGIGGSNNFSNINFTVQYRAVRAALREYDPEQRYVTPEYAAKLLDWMAWSIYPGGDARVANQAEYYSNWDPETRTMRRNNPNHVMLGNMNYVFVEDMGGIQPRSDDLIELSPIDLGYEHFMVNDLRYHGHDVTIVWDPDGSHYGLGAGYSLFVDGKRLVAADGLGRFVYDPGAGEVVEADEGLDVDVVGKRKVALPAAVDTPVDDERVVDYLRTAGIDLSLDAENLADGATLSSSATQEGARPTPWREFHTPGWSTSSMNHTPGAVATTEQPVSLDAVTDGSTANEPYWGNHGTGEDTGYVELDLGERTHIDDVRVWFVSDRQAGGYHEPRRWTVQVPDGDGGWRAVPGQARTPRIPGPKLNASVFDKVRTDRLRVAFTNEPGHATAISEIQVFRSGEKAPDVENAAPEVTARADRGDDGNLSTTLVATVADDGLPEDGTLTHAWETVSTPDGADAILADPESLRTRVTGTAPGEYTFRLTASDGALTTARDVTVALAERDAAPELGATATVTTSGSAPWEDPQKVNDAGEPATSAPGAGQGWGTWGQEANGTSEASEAWLEYSWDSPVRLSSTGIFWYDDGGGTRMPRAETYVVEHSEDGETWEAVTLTGGSTYADALQRDTTNRLDFETVETSHLRLRVWGVQGDGAGTGVLRWRAFGNEVGSVRPVVMRTTTGVVPELPARVDVTYADGSHGTLPFTWQRIDPERVAEPNVEPFVTRGTNDALGLVAEAQVYVRPETAQGGIAIQGVEQLEDTVAVGERPYLPRTVLVSYNDGSRDNQAVAVEWHLDESVLQTPGTYEVPGDLVLPDYVSEAGATSTTLTLTVVAPGAAGGPPPGGGGGPPPPGRVFRPGLGTFTKSRRTNRMPRDHLPLRARPRRRELLRVRADALAGGPGTGRRPRRGLGGPDLAPPALLVPRALRRALHLRGPLRRGHHPRGPRPGHVPDAGGVLPLGRGRAPQVLPFHRGQPPPLQCLRRGLPRAPLRRRQQTRLVLRLRPVEGLGQRHATGQTADRDPARLPCQGHPKPLRPPDRSPVVPHTERPGGEVPVARVTTARAWPGRSRASSARTGPEPGSSVSGGRRLGSVAICQGRTVSPGPYHRDRTSLGEGRAHGVRQAGPDRSGRLARHPRLHELRRPRARTPRLEPRRGDQQAVHPAGPRRRRQLLRHRQRLLGRPQRGDRRPGAGRVRRPRRDRPGHQGVHADAPGPPQRRRALAQEHHGRDRPQPAAAGHRLRGPLPDPSLRPHHPAGGDRRSPARRGQGGQGPLRRRLLDVRLAVRQGPAGGRRQRLDPVRHHAEPLQPALPRGGAGDAAVVRGRGYRGDPVEPARPGAADPRVGYGDRPDQG